MGWLFYGVRHTPAGEKVKKILIGSSSSCFGGFPALTADVPASAKIDNRIFISTYYTREQFNKFVKALRDEYAEGFTFEYNKGTKDEVVRHFPRPTIGFYERESKARGYCDEFAAKLADKKNRGFDLNYCSITIPEGANGYEAFAMLKIMTKQLSSPQAYRPEFEVWERAYDATGNFQAACIVCCNSGATAGYTYPVSLSNHYGSVIGKDFLHALLNRKGPLMLPGTIKNLQIGHIERYFQEPITEAELANYTGSRSVGSVNHWFNRYMSTGAKCFPYSNPSDVPRGSREAVNFNFSGNQLAYPQQESEVMVFITKALKGEYE